ncbi:MAG: ComF family protein [Clostridiales bacterium]|nr:ComF family protein [Clostridiales bacterium]MCF8022903.1 ComF family protein [Clostridiales bacterium]
MEKSKCQVGINYLWKGLLDLLFPPREVCPLCGEKSPGAVICEDCLGWLEKYKTMPYCPVCGRFIETGASEGGVRGSFPPCIFCKNKRPYFNAARAPAPYRGVLHDAVLQLKSRGTGQVVSALARLMAETVRRESIYSRVEMIIPVPLSSKRYAARGFNQAELLAVELGRILDLPVDNGTVFKIKETRPQTSLSRVERIQNLQDSFSIIPNKIPGKIVLLVDDVITTGSTVENISIKLREARVKEIYVLTAAGGFFTI